MLTLNFAQNSPEWLAARCGIPTSSHFDKIITTKGEPSKQAKKYLYQLAGERVTGIKEEGFQNGIMQKAYEREDEARKFYELANDVEIVQVGLCYPNEDKDYACSPDGLVGEDGLLEIKCPLMSTHVSYLLDDCLPMDYFQQVQGQLLVTGRKWVDFLSYFPGLKPLVVRVRRHEVFIKSLKIELEIFCKNLKDIVEKIK